jgi:hypothetical protein
LGDLSDPMGRNVSEACAGLESDNADADPPAIWGRLHERGSKPSNAGGGKDPDFWCAFDDGEVRVIGDEPRNT